MKGKTVHDQLDSPGYGENDDVFFDASEGDEDDSSEPTTTDSTPDQHVNEEFEDSVESEVEILMADVETDSLGRVRRKRYVYNSVRFQLWFKIDIISHIF